jgi:hypothetical protein
MTHGATLGVFSPSWTYKDPEPTGVLFCDKIVTVELVLSRLQMVMYFWSDKRLKYGEVYTQKILSSEEK